jgi:predicted 3-demethylubiquinone-9 3-methyltransferase (glyoxalase superfamily)
MTAKVSTFLMFFGQAEAAMNFYVSLFPDARIINRAEGSVKPASFTLNGQNFMCFDSPVKHDFTFTPAISIFVTCDSEAEVDRLFNALSEGGQIFMPLDAYPFSKRFGWTTDRFGVSWQIMYGGA